MSPEHSSYGRSASRMSDMRPVLRPKVSSWPPPSLRNPAKGNVSPGSGRIVRDERVSKETHEPAREKARVSDTYTGGVSSRAPRSRPWVKIFGALGVVLAACSLLWFAFVKGREMKQAVMTQGEAGYSSLTAAAESLKAQQYSGSLSHFNEAYQSFSQASDSISVWGDTLVDLTRYVPGFSKAASGKHVIEAGKHFAAAGIPLSRVAAEASLSKDAYVKGEKISLLDFLRRIQEPLVEAQGELRAANQALESVRIEDIPEEKREKFLVVKQSLPVLLGLVDSFEQQEPLIEELLGGNGPRKYLFLLQNNHEARATGGFIGSYGLLDVNNGVVRKFFVDGIFNPDGQLKENIVPPKPIQKISAGWSLHDSNWFPDFSVSAEKAIFFYEKTGGPTVDGVITLTPAVMQKLLAVIGPITLPQYGLVIDAENFIPVVQEQVEVKYDKTENQPKKVLADICFVLMEKVFASQDRQTLTSVASALVEGLSERHILLYARHPETQALIERGGWSGEVLETPKDYLSVIHTNINGYKTDGVISEVIKHKAEIAADGSITDTVTITRTHAGGNTPYDWWNKVNADYLRVYVPKGSQLLSAKGATWEFPEAPLDYEALGFKRDEDVEREEQGMTIDEKSGTRISEDADKTVFGAWVYVSPQESVTVEYQYLLPFRLDMREIAKGGVDSYSSLYQKQSGSIGSALEASIFFPDGVRSIWQTGTNLVPYGRELRFSGDLKTDVFTGSVFGSGL